jgi:hypothetical protein
MRTEVFFDPFAILPKLFINGKKPLPLINADSHNQPSSLYEKSPMESADIMHSLTRLLTSDAGMRYSG